MDSVKTREIFLQLLRSVIADGDGEIPKDVGDYVDEVIALAKKQDVLQLICRGVMNHLGSLKKSEQNEMLAEIYRYKRNDYLLETARRILTSAKIRYAPLKGAFIKELYPERWMRGSCDVDILIHEEDIQKAVNALQTAGFRTEQKREYHDISLFYGGAHLELHFNICENIWRIDRVLNRVWDYVEPISEYEYREEPAFFAFHLIAHLLYHFLRGGCNIKQFVDLWLMRKNKYYQENELKVLLAKANLEKFYEVVCQMTEVWFDDGETTALTCSVEEQVFNGGIAGASKYSDTISIFVSGGKIRYVFSSIFLPLREMKWYYPPLNHHPALLPAYYVKRFFSKTVGREKNRAKKLLHVNLHGKDTMQENIITLLDEMGLG